MLTWWRRRRDRQQQVVRDADNLVALFGDGARARHEFDAGGDPDHWLAVRREIAWRVGKDIGLDTGTRYLSRYPRAMLDLWRDHTLTLTSRPALDPAIFPDCRLLKRFHFAFKPRDFCRLILPTNEKQRWPENDKPHARCYGVA